MTDKITNERQVFGSYLQRLLRERKIGQSPLAACLGTTVGTISKYTTGRNLPDDDKMEGITDFLRNFLSETELIELTKLYLNASTSIKLVDSQGYSLSDIHFLKIFNEQTLMQQKGVLELMLQNAEDNRVQMAQNAGFVNETPGTYNAPSRKVIVQAKASKKGKKDKS